MWGVVMYLYVLCSLYLSSPNFDTHLVSCLVSNNNISFAHRKKIKLNYSINSCNFTKFIEPWVINFIIIKPL